MHGRLEGEQTPHGRHMWPVPASDLSSVRAAEIVSLYPNFYLKDGRKIQIGECALFKPSSDFPPFIGIIRRLISGKGDSLSLRVSWLYRPADIKLGKGVLLEAAPNEVFYSFHKDEIPAASLLHPCKVAFLCKGVELPAGISSFVCRRVYDIENKCLWWLTDKDYTNERQEEVNQLLDKTRIEMYGAVQQGGRSPKPLNGPTTTPQTKPGSDCVQNSSSSLSSQVKGKKRERNDQVSDPVKRERLSRNDDAECGQFRPEHVLKSEIAKITDKGGLVDLEGVEKLVQLMQIDSAEKKIDLTCRIMLVDVLAFTDRFDCLGHFVQLRGLLVLDEWLQEVHKGKIGDGCSSKVGDKTVEEFLLALLRALDKLPVNLHALQTCNVGKSVNHLRTNKNSEVQKKARYLVDTWKKRVEAEMNIIDAKSGSGRGGSWPAKSLISEVAHVGGRRAAGSLEAGVKNSVTQPLASKPQSVKPGSGDSVMKYSSLSPGSTRLSASLATSGTANSKDLNSATLVGGVISEGPLTTIKEEKSSNSSQSHNNSQSCSSDQTKTGATSCWEDARSSTAGSMSVNILSGGVSHNQKLVNSLHGSTVSVVQKETGSAKFVSPNQNLISENLLPKREPCDKVPDFPIVDNGNSQQLIVMLPNASRSPACSASGESPEDPSITSCKSYSPGYSEKFDYHDRKAKGKSDILWPNDSSKTNVDSLQNNVSPTGSNEFNRSASCAPCDKKSWNNDDEEKHTEADKGVDLSSRITIMTGKSYEASFSSMNALLESCAKFSENNVSTSLGDDIGMNLLASVATGEILRSDASPLSSPGRTSHTPEDSFSGNDVLRQLEEGGCQSDDKANVAASSKQDTNKEGNDTVREGVDHCHEQWRSAVSIAGHNNVSDLKPKVSSSLLDQEKNVNHADERATNKSAVMKMESVVASAVLGNEAKEELPCHSSSEMGMEDKDAVRRQSGSCVVGWKNPPHVGSGKAENNNPSSGFCNVLVKELESSDLQTRSHSEQTEKRKIDVEASDLLPKCKQLTHESESESKDVLHPPGDSAPHEDSPAMPVQESERCLMPNGCEQEEVKINVAGKPVVTNSSSLSNSGLDVTIKLEFDLNEGFPTDEGSQGEPVKSSTPGNSSICLPCPLPFSIPSLSGSFPTSVTVAAAAKGAFIPPENTFRIKGELGWKGSAATSAFRPAEPRKVLDMPFTTSDVPLVDNIINKQNCPRLDIDLNVPDEKMFEDVACQSYARLTRLESGSRDLSGGGLDFDLNRVEENPELLPVSNSCRLEILQLSSKAPVSGGFSKAESNMSRDFDLNSGPGPDEPCPQAALHVKNNLPLLSSVSGVRVNNTELGNSSSWFPPGNFSPAIAIPSLLSSRGEQSYPVPASGPHRISVPPSASSSFCPEIYRGPVLSSSPALAFPSTAPFQYPGFPFETNFPLQSSSYAAGSIALDSSSAGPICFPTISSQLVGPTGMVSNHHYPRPYLVGMPGGAGNVGPENRKRATQGLDLNAGPGGADRDEKLPCGLRQLPVSGSQVLAEEQLKMYQMAGGVFKRKEPGGGWDGDRISYKQPPWQ